MGNILRVACAGGAASSYRLIWPLPLLKLGADGKRSEPPSACLIARHFRPSSVRDMAAQHPARCLLPGCVFLPLVGLCFFSIRVDWSGQKDRGAGPIPHTNLLLGSTKSCAHSPAAFVYHLPSSFVDPIASQHPAVGSGSHDLGCDDGERTHRVAALCDRRQPQQPVSPCFKHVRHL